MFLPFGMKRLFVQKCGKQRIPLMISKACDNFAIHIVPDILRNSLYNSKINENNLLVNMCTLVVVDWVLVFRFTEGSGITIVLPAS